MDKLSLNSRKKDVLIGISLSIMIGVLAASSLGFLREGLDAPVSYNANDDFSIISQIKQLTQEPWIWSTDRLGAPYSQQVYDYSSFFLQNIEFLIIKLYSLFTKSVPLIENILYLNTFSLCGLSSYFVMRKMNLKRGFAFCGSVLYAFSPYIYGRNIMHYCLTACYFVPVAVLLCYKTYQNDEFLKFDRSFWSWRTLWILISCACIANNGIGYYPFFTCFLLCVSALCKLLKTRKIRSIIPQIKVVFCIALFMAFSLLPTYLYHLKNGANEIAARSPVETEIYSLKITQLFIPLFTHGIGWLTDLVNGYNWNMPLVNENVTSYLGVLGCTGALIGIIIIFNSNEGSGQSEEIFLFSRLNLASILFMSVGGFISLLAIISKIYVMRGFNRISIFIMFCSLLILMFLMQSAYDKLTKQWMKKFFWLIFALIIIFGLWDQTPVIVDNGGNLAYNRQLWNNDEQFVNEIEKELNAGDMVFQLPYHQYPEGGSVNEMKDYQLLVGYIHSDTLKWSFGGIKNRESDRWNKYVSELTMPEMINTLASSGFKGIYIDKRAYTEDEYKDLSGSIEKILNETPLVSSDKNLIFYNLYPYIENNPELLQEKPLTVEEIEYW